MVAAKCSRCWQFVQVQRADLHFRPVYDWPELNAQLGNTPAQQLAVLRQHSLPEGTPEGVLHKRLRSAGLSDELGSDLQEWLGSDLTLYFTR
jgi:hypothetical protein